MPTVAGDYTVKAIFAPTIYYHEVEATADFTIQQKEIGLNWTSTEFTYDGTSHKPEASATGLSDGDACAITVTGEQTDAGTYTATASELSNPNYKLPATATTTFTIAQRALTLIANDQEITFGSTIHATIENTHEVGLESEHTIASITLSTDKTEAGVYENAISISGAVIKCGDTDVTANYAITYVPGKLTILTKAAEGLTVSTPADAEYNGGAIKPEVTVKAGDNVLTAGTDYDVTYNSNTFCGEAELVVTFKGSYSGSIVKYFRITQKSLTLTANNQTITYGESINSAGYSQTGLIDGHTITEAVVTTDQTIAGTHEGALQVSAAIIKNGEQDVTENYTITYVPGSLTIGQVSGGLSVNDLADETYTGSAITPEPVVMAGGTVLIKDTDYSVSYSNNTNTGTATVNVTFQGNYAGSIIKTFNILPREITIDWGRTSFVYDGDPHLPTANVAEPMGADVCILTVTGEQTDVGDYVATVTGLDNPNYKLPSVLTRAFSITRRPLTLTAKDQEVIFGSPIHATVDNLDEEGLESEHTIASITLTATQTTTGIHEGGITIGEAVIKSGETDVTANYAIIYIPGLLTILAKATDNLTAADLEDYTYTGQPICPEPTVKDGDVILNKNEDYTLTYNNNTNRGEGEVVISFKNNYTGNIVKYFTIHQKALTITAHDQTQTYGIPLSDTMNDVTVDGLVEGHTISEIDIFTYETAIGIHPNAIHVGAAIITFEGIDMTENYTVSYFPGKLTIVEKPSAEITIDDIPTQVYTGNAVTPTPIVRCGTTLLVEGTDYTVSYENNMDEGNGRIIIILQNSYSGYITKDFLIQKIAASLTTVPAVIPGLVYTGDSQN